jgi:hypothetical protein
MGFSDEQISRITQHGDEEDVYKNEKQLASQVYIKWWTPAQPSLKQRLLISIQHSNYGHLQQRKWRLPTSL